MYFIGVNYQNCEKAWGEQRDFLWMALDKLSSVQPLYAMIKQSLSELLPQEPDLSSKCKQFSPLNCQAKGQIIKTTQDTFLKVIRFTQETHCNWSLDVILCRPLAISSLKKVSVLTKFVWEGE